MPGMYILAYSVTNEDGRSASTTRQLYVYQAAAVTVPLDLYTGVTTQNQAITLVAGLRNTSLPAYATGIDDILQKLGRLSEQVDSGDVDIAGAGWVQNGPGSFTVRVNATVYVYTPKGVHRQDIANFERPRVATQEAGTYSTAPQRHLLWTDSPDSASEQTRWQAVSAAMLHGTTSSGITAPAAMQDSTISTGASHANQRRMAAEPPAAWDWQQEHQQSYLHGTTSSRAYGAMSSAPASGERNSQHKAAEQAVQNLQQSINFLEQMLISADCDDTAGDGITCRVPRAGPAIWGSSVEYGVSRRMLQTTQEQDLATLIASLSADLGTNVTSQALTAQGVDLLTVSLALASAWFAVGHSAGVSCKQGWDNNSN